MAQQAKEITEGLMTLISNHAAVSAVCASEQKIIERDYVEASYLIWSKLSQGAQGYVVATAACLPVWEALNFLTSSLYPVENNVRGYFLIMLTSLYPKYRDRRCLYQHLSGYGEGNGSVPLTATAPFKSGKRSTSTGFTDHTVSLDNFCSDLKQKDVVVPRIIKGFISHVNNQSPAAFFSDEGISFPDYLSFIWICVLFTNIYSLPEGRELVALTQAKCKTLFQKQQFAEFTFLVNHILNYSEFLLHAGVSSAEPLTNNPLLDRSVIKQIISRQSGYLARNKKWNRKGVLKGVVNICESSKRDDRTFDVFSRITECVNEKDANSPCRRNDELTSLCRDVVFRYRKASSRKCRYNCISKVAKKLMFSSPRTFSILPENVTSLLNEEKEYKSSVLEEAIHDCFSPN